MVDTFAEGPRPEALPVAEVVVEINRDTGRVLARDAEIYARGGESVPPDLPQQVRWIVRTGLLADELVIVFGKPLAWSGPVSAADAVPHVENAFSGPLTLGRTCAERTSGPPHLSFPRGIDLVSWPYGIVVMRGQDTPLIAHPRILIRRYH